MSLAESQSLNLTIFVPGIGHLRGSDLEDFLGAKRLRTISKGEAKTGSGNHISLVSVTTIVPRREHGVIVGLWCGNDMISKLEECIYAKDVVVLTQTTTEIANWISNKKPNILNG